MPDERTPDTTTGESPADQKQCDVLGWATLGPSTTITVPSDQDIADISHNELVQALRTDLQERGFSPSQIEQMHIEVDYVEESLHSP